MKFVSLLKATSFSGLRVSPFDGVKQYLSTGDLQENDISLVDILYEEKPSRADIFVNEGDILFARMKGTIKVLEITQKLSGIIVSTGFAVIRPNNEFISQYLYFYLKSDAFQRQKDKYCSGAIQPAITNAGLGKIKVPLLPLEVQKRTAYLLSKIELLIKQRKQSLQHLDDFIKSVFLDMFGPDNKDYLKWSNVTIESLAAKHKGAIRTGPFGSNLLHNEFIENGEVAVLGIDNAVSNKFSWKLNRTISIKKYEQLKQYRVYPNDVIITIMGTVGRSAVIPKNIPLAINTKHLAAITLNDKLVNSLFFAYSIHSNPDILKQFKSKGRGAIMDGLNLRIIKQTKLRRPPVELQNHFATIVEKVEKIKEQNQQSLTELENLYGAVSQKAFKGELDLEKIPLIEVPQTQQYFDNINKEQDTQTITQAKSSRYLYPFLKGVDILTVKGRLELIKFWFEQFFKNIKKGNPLSIEAFWQNAQFNFEPYRDKQLNIAEKNNNSDEVDAINNLNLGIQEYDFLKTLIFEKLDEGLLHQELSEVEKVELAQLTNENDLDTKNTIILKK